MQEVRLVTRLLLLDLDAASSTGGALQALLQAHTEPDCLRCQRLNEDGLKGLAQELKTTNPGLVFAVLPSLSPPLFPRLIETLARVHPRPPVIAVLDTENLELLQQARDQGVADFLFPPLRPVEVVSRLLHWIAPLRGESRAWTELKNRLGLEELVGEAPRFVEAIRCIPAIAQRDTGVLITGETGTGKDLIARAIHMLSARKANPFYPLNCATLRPGLLENELFGHRAGAFTGATTTTQGIIAAVNTGTLFLDEVQALTSEAQTMLLRFLEDRVWRPVGSPAFQTADLRIIAASNRDLEEEVRQKRFREDLLYRLKVVRIELPPLRERPEDVALLARFFLNKLLVNAPHFAVQGFTAGALDKLKGYHWPGNVRQLANAIEQAVVVANRTLLEAKDIQLPSNAPGAGPVSWRETKTLAERKYLEHFLEECADNISQAAKKAGMDRRVFVRRMRKVGL